MHWSYKESEGFTIKAFGRSLKCRHASATELFIANNFPYWYDVSLNDRTKKEVGEDKNISSLIYKVILEEKRVISRRSKCPS